MTSSSSLSEYLKKYTSDQKPKSDKKKKTKPDKKKKPNSCVNGGGVRIVDEDALWQAEIKDDSSHEDSPDEGPQVTEDVEVKRMKRMEELKMHRPYLTVASDGSGWVTVSHPNKPGLQPNDLSSNEQGSTDPPNDSKMQSAFLNNHLSSPNKNCGSVDQRDLQYADRQSNYERDNSNYHDSEFLKQKKVQHGSPNISPPRKARTKSPDFMPPRKCQKDIDSLHPLPQRKVRHDSPDQSPTRKDSAMSPDLSPPRKHQKNDGSDKLPSIKVRYNSPDQFCSRKAHAKSPDLSPPRKHQKNVGFSGPFPQTKVRHDSPDLSWAQKAQTKSPDLSPPRKRLKDVGSLDTLPQMKFRHDSPDPSLPRKAWTKPVDLSPPRRHQKDISSSNPLPQSRTRHDSPNRKDSTTQHDSHARNAQVKDCDFSPPRRIRHISSGRTNDSPTKKQTITPTKTDDQILSERYMMDKAKEKERMGDGTSAGLRTGKDLKSEIDRKKREESQRFSKMDSSLSGRGAETVYRDKQGKRLEGVEEFLQLQQGQRKPEAKPLEWGKGLAQKREAEAKQAELELEKNKPFARSRDDPELEKMLKERVRWGDPMAHLVKKTNIEPMLENLDDDEKMKESGFIIPQSVPSHSWLKRGVDPPVNRYGIKPGRHWDGVDRSNGFERESFKRQNEKQATETEAYL
ncbi:hypothetical protein KI387_036160, partial [Taxus chinensis]